MITFTNIFKINVLDSLRDLLVGEFPAIQIHYDEHKGNQSFLLIPQGDDLIELEANGQSRSYSILISYQLKRGGEYSRNTIDNLTSIAEHIKRLIHNNSAYSPSGTYKFHDGRAETVEYQRDEDDPSLHRALIGFSCSVTEVI